MRIDAGVHGVLEAPSRLIDAATGTILLRLVPHHLTRLHPPELRGNYVPCDGDASSPYKFPLLVGTKPVDITLNAGMRPSDVSAGITFESAGSQWSRSWWRWIAYALTPFGWVNHPTPQFIRKGPQHEQEDLLASLSLAPSCGANAQNFRAAQDWLVSELGSPQGSPDRRVWRFEWGTVGLTYEQRDGAAEVSILWEPLNSELLAEIRSKIGKT